MTPVTIGRRVLDRIVAHARAAAPDECCGLLLGNDAGIDEACAARNLRASPRAYLIDPADHFAAIRKARTSSRRVVGAYHSHPRGPATPSATDAAEADDPSLLHVIVSLAPTLDVRAFALEGRNFRPVTIVPLP